MIVEECGVLEEENRVLHSLVLLALMEVCKANQEVEEVTLERDALVEDLDNLKERNKLLRKRGKELHNGKALVEGELGRTKEELS